MQWHSLPNIATLVSLLEDPRVIPCITSTKTISPMLNPIKGGGYETLNSGQIFELVGLLDNIPKLMSDRV